MMLLIMNPTTLSMSPQQWPVILVGMASGFLGSTIDSVLGATLQYSGKYKQIKIITNFHAKFLSRKPS
jgi:uncharacterized membrane protein